MWLYAFSSIDRILTENFAFWTCDSCLRVADFRIFTRNLPKIYKYNDQFFFITPPYELAKLLHTNNQNRLSNYIPKSSHVRTIQTPHCLHHCSCTENLPFQESTAPSSTNVQRKHI